MPSPDPDPTGVPSATERHFFHNHGYLVLENFLTAAHVTRMLAALDQAVKRRRAEVPAGWRHTWPAQARADLTQLHGKHSTRLLHILEDDPLFLELLTCPAILPYVKSLLNPNPHYHASDAIVESGEDYLQRAGDWHIDGNDNGYRGLGWPIPLLQLKVGYYLSDMTKPWRGNLTVVPGSHLARVDPTPEDRKRRELFPGAVQVCAPAGTAILFHNALWHTASPFEEPDAGRKILYYGYEHPWMLGSLAHWNYSRVFYNQRLNPEQRKFFHGFLFDPPEQRF